MPFGIVLLLINVGLIVHAAKTGRFWPWGYIILFIPGLGALAYVLVEMAPEWFGSVQGQKARRHVVNTLDPSKRYRALTEQLDVTDTIANRAALAEECLELGKFTEAEYHYERILALPMGDDPIYAFGRARAQFGRSHSDEAVATLDDLRKRWPDTNPPQIKVLCEFSSRPGVHPLISPRFVSLHRSLRDPSEAGGGARVGSRAASTRSLIRRSDEPGRGAILRPSTIANVSGTAREKSRRTICDFFPKNRKRFCGTRKAKGLSRCSRPAHDGTAQPPLPEAPNIDAG